MQLEQQTKISAAQWLGGQLGPAVGSCRNWHLLLAWRHRKIYSGAVFTVSENQPDTNSVNWIKSARVGSATPNFCFALCHESSQLGFYLYPKLKVGILFVYNKGLESTICFALFFFIVCFSFTENRVKTMDLFSQGRNLINLLWSTRRLHGKTLCKLIDPDSISWSICFRSRFFLIHDSITHCALCSFKRQNRKASRMKRKSLFRKHTWVD